MSTETNLQRVSLSICECCASIGYTESMEPWRDCDECARLNTPELFARDVEVYGNKAYLMWYWDSCISIINCASNDDVFRLIKKGFNLKRKTSAAKD